MPRLRMRNVTKPTIDVALLYVAYAMRIEAICIISARGAEPLVPAMGYPCSAAGGGEPAAIPELFVYSL